MSPPREHAAAHQFFAVYQHAHLVGAADDHQIARYSADRIGCLLEDG